MQYKAPEPMIQEKLQPVVIKSKQQKNSIFNNPKNSIFTKKPKNDENFSRFINNKSTLEK